MREEIIKKVKWNIKRDSLEDKQRALLELFDPIKKDLKHQVCMQVLKECTTRLVPMCMVLFSYYFLA